MNRKHGPLTIGRLTARKVLSEAARFVGRDVIVVAKDRGGSQYLATSMPGKSSAEYEPQITMVREALKSLLRYQRRARAVEKEKEKARGKEVPQSKGRRRQHRSEEVRQAVRRTPAVRQQRSARSKLRA